MVGQPQEIPSATESSHLGSTVQRILLGSELRRLREVRGISRKHAGHIIRASEGKIAQLELGQIIFERRDVADLLTLYGVSDEQDREAMLQLADATSTPDWWHHHADVLPSWFRTHAGLEEVAELIRTYDPRFVPVLLQVEDYARAALHWENERGRKFPAKKETERGVKLRMQRQQRLQGPNPLRLWAIFDETTLRRPIGGPEVMRRQLEHLIDMSRLPNITLQVIPFGSGAFATESGTFSILRFPGQHLPDVVYIETLVATLYIDSPTEVESYKQAMDRLCVFSEPPDRTEEILRQILRSYELKLNVAPGATGWAGVSIYLDTDDSETIRRVQESVDELADLVGYEGPFDTQIERGSFIRRSWAKLRNGVTSEEVKRRLSELERAAQLRIIDKEQAEADAKRTDALHKILDSVQGNACIFIGSLLIIKYDGNTYCRHLSQREMLAMHKFPEIQTNPAKALEALSLAVDSLEGRTDRR